MLLANRIADLLGDEPLLDVVVACASAAAIAIKELPADQRQDAQREVHALIDEMLKEWTVPHETS